ncbi:hypothetical protein Syn7803C76_147 [Synechococcus phage ACG-2014b]|uniref:Gp165 n=2 Tax=Synechococcus phage ACG-2014b TaxID=1493508 RepID=A0A0E3FSW5_9CAUD|nr:hypothetical protein ABF04_gp147 [Synechococcus phage ACG-2014b]YP_009779772.1 hypothetical protein HOQ67_gp144 [Synechococcus phage ACG-2014b]AIX17366.1 hypothetical protein Syn7803C61_144 [Synechococcus phage ACG-2014b]AIX18014.1 hypothetical protein Syn7803C68_146 [Synechococcus phage ACG-2014b]AIX18229.1 hypothetical protein Syn7803C69_145 [Synechococcus phage ACG-2014b]AIX19387.1 hypothetical protein Syn7803C76_147 [Synechococcus phage ACG-2014b]AIX19821.1 hypothetical protein Syn7803
MDGCNKQTDIHTDDTRGSVSVHRNLQRTWFKQPNDYPENNRGYKHNRHYKYLLAVTLLFANPSYAETVGGVSATANPVANSSGSVTNQAIQVLQGPYITNTYGGGIQCQGPTRNFTPYVTGSVSASKPYEDYYDDPVYDVTDNFGAYDSDGNPMGDGILDNPGDISFYKKTRTGQKDNYSLGVGFSMTWSTPTDKKLQDLCKEAATSNIEMMKQLTANKRLDFEIARLKNCGNLMKEGISFHPRSPYYKICADVVVQNVTTVKQHRHSIPSVSVPTSIPVLPDSDDAALLGAPLETRP